MRKIMLLLALGAAFALSGCSEDTPDGGGGGGGSTGPGGAGGGGAGGLDGEAGTGGAEGGAGGEGGAAGEGGAGGEGGTAGEGGAGGEGGAAGEGSAGEGGEPDPAPFSIELQADGCFDLESCAQLFVGEARTFRAAVFDEDGELLRDPAIRWTSSDDAIATVVGGMVTALGPGEVTISAVAEPAHASLVLTIAWDTVEQLIVETDAGAAGALALEGKTVTLVARGQRPGMFFPIPAQLFDPSWTVEDPTVATIESQRETPEGSTIVLKALRVGSTVITAKARPENSPPETEVLGSAVLTVLGQDIAPPRFSLARIGIGDGSACGVTQASVAYCWGDNSEQQLGAGSFEFRELVPLQVEGGHGFTQVVVGAYHACGLDTAGAAWCWGANYDGQLGIDEADGEIFSAPKPTLVGGGYVFTSLSAGQNQTCGIDEEGGAFCWGSNAQGRLGIDSTEFNVRAPTAVAGGHRFRRITLGTAFGCGIDREGAAWCWGYHAGGLGIGNPPGSPTRQNAPVAVIGAHRFDEIEASSNHVCALRDDQTVWCWGRGAEGQLGIPALPDDPVSTSWEPVQVQGGKLFEQIAVGFEHSCGLDDRGVAFCWGGNGSGQLGTGDFVGTDEPVEVHGDLRYDQLAAGGGSTCSITVEGGAYCWGSNDAGTLGQGTAGNELPLPVPVHAPTP